jgi:hypothetical protein
MDNNILVPLSRQLLPRIVATVLAIGLLIFSLNVWLYQTVSALESRIQVVLPNVELALAQSQHQKNLQYLHHQIVTAELGDNISQLHSELLAVIIDLQVIDENAKFSNITDFDKTVVERLSQKSDSNELIRQTGQNQVSLFLVSIDNLLQDNESRSTEQTLALRYIKSLATRIAADIQILNLQLSEPSFEQLSNNIEQLFVAFESLSSQYPEVFSSAGIVLQIQSLQGVLLTEQRLIGKWRGHIRLYQEYKTLISTELTTYLQQALIAHSSSQAEQSSVEQNATIWGLPLTQSQFSLFLMSFIVLNVLLILWLLVSVYRKVVLHQQLLIESVEATIRNKSDDEVSCASEDINQVCARIIQVAIPRHSEEDYQVLKSELNNRLDIIADLSNATEWEIKQGKLDSASKTRITRIAELSSEKVASWRRLFSYTQLRTIVEKARQTQSSGEVQRTKVTLTSGLHLELTIGKKNDIWFGTIAQDIESASLIQANDALKLEHDSALALTHQKLLHSSTSLSKMLVQAMLHSQNLALVSGASVQTSYRPLMRMFESVKQQQVLAQLSLNDQARNLQDVILVNEIYCAAYNVIAEANLQQNKILLECDDNLASDAQVDVRIFGRLLVAFCRVALKQEFKSTLALSVSAIDQNAGQQLLKLTANVKTAKPMSELPSHAKLLHEGAIDSGINDVESYFVALLHLLHGTSLQANLTEHGYVISFELPITTSTKQQSKVVQFPFSPTNVLVLCSDKSKQSIVKKYLELPSTKVEGLAKIELFSKQYDIQRLTRRKLDLVIYIDDSHDQLSYVYEHIESLPKSKRPKLVVLQDSYHASLSKQGLYSLVSAPFSRDFILQECERLLRSDERNNQLVSYDVFKNNQYLPSQVELLLAVKTPQKYQSLWLVLQWLGFHVKVVCHGKSMQKHWQSGRYLVLLNEFEHSPFIELDTGKSIARGVFNFFADEVITLDEAEAEIGKNWELGAVPEINRIDALIKLLTPWLKKSPKAEARHANKESGVRQVPEQNGKGTGHSKIFDSSLIEQLPPAFGLQEYATNQGSAELAVYMLDDYILSIDEGIIALEKCLQEKTYQDFESILNSLKLTAKILSAKGLLQISQQLNQALQNEAYDNLGRLLEQAKIELSAIKAYAEAI